MRTPLILLVALSALCGTACDGGGSSGGSGGTGGNGGSGGASGGSGGAGGAAGGSGGAATGGAGGSGDAEPAEMVGMTAAHNAARAAVNPPANPALPPLSWSSSIAAVAQAYAENCVWEHSGGPYGENLYATTGGAAPADVVSSWVSEVADYDYASNSCSNVCGHYTQVVWRDSQLLGCGVADCSQNSPFGGGNWQIWVCNYDPPGNFGGQKPY